MLAFQITTVYERKKMIKPDEQVYVGIPNGERRMRELYSVRYSRCTCHWFDEIQAPVELPSSCNNGNLTKRDFKV